MDKDPDYPKWIELPGNSRALVFDHEHEQAVWDFLTGKVLDEVDTWRLKN